MVKFNDNRMPQRFWNKIVVSHQGCWIWVASAKPEGYGQYSHKLRMRLAHRVVYIETRGKVPKGLELDHLCRNRLCVNPNHLEAVTHQVNSQRGDSGKHNAIKTHCPNGHPLSGANLISRTKNNGRKCRICHAIISQRCRKARDAKRKELENG